MAVLLPVPALASDPHPDLTAMVRTVAQEVWPPGKIPAGSGFFVSADGDVLTASHVIAGCAHISIRDRSRKTSASVVGVDTRIDAALLHAGLNGHAFLTPARADTVPDPQLTLLTRSWTNGTASALTMRLLKPSGQSGQSGLMQLSGRVQPGASGAAIVNSRGDVEAFLIGRMADRHDIALAMPAENLRGFLAYFTGTRGSLRRADSGDDTRQEGNSLPAKLHDAAVAVACVR
jgi:S1-C subfamily serine protease